ncbi:hypothetical protein [Kitasatospora purpeofusca]|uniref:hypothetical protein n=1 Tax=Kitasatospora purpeofusca TaxID=67352 RepID=UPI002A59ABBF|nr:hypothetical protein [Kitasatospora purpeofusca]MDY0815468.1 hypothetical protein [Kitasatospora purpeofusca]
MADPWAIASGVGALASVAGAWAVYRGQTRQVDFELARTLHLDLTSGEVALARYVLVSFRRGQHPYGPEVLAAYFTMLWCFERVLQGRRSMIRSPLDRVRRSSPVRFLDEALAMHVASWERNLPEIRRRLNEALAEAHGDELRDRGLTAKFEALARALRSAGVMPPPVPVALPPQGESAPAS